MEEITIITTSTEVTNSYQIDIVFHEVIIQTLRSDRDIRDLIHNSSSLYDAGNASPVSFLLLPYTWMKALL
ncbi:hypothetical protein DYBT9275_05683 [Dyadobacter sp. CECT 9275]|uniref:Uncharacterized protein n=1 Tax=Dyadobacter helix TaxID=2822344 RepID=A0A916JIA9_9BACT|nr:hypothetical protein [Dyadobacter sp. CECT 9275]CAG5017016.1 hypothetical protein DYBT9275_05683 [Dyadobacter sp. CECT 9275]